MMLKIAYILIFFLFLPFRASAQETIVMNEIAWMGTPVENVEQNNWWRYEWVELYNPTASPIVLDGWTIELYRQELDFQIPLQGTIKADGYFLVGASDKIPNLDLNYSNLSGKLVNSGQRAVLSRCARSPEGRKDNNCEIVEELDARQGWFRGDNSLKKTMERWNPSQPANDPENWGTSLEIGGTPKAENSIFGKDLTILSQQTPQNGYAIAGQENGLLGPSTDIINQTTGVAFLIALLSALVILLLKQYLRSAEG